MVGHAYLFVLFEVPVAEEVPLVVREESPLVVAVEFPEEVDVDVAVYGILLVPRPPDTENRPE